MSGGTPRRADDRTVLLGERGPVRFRLANAKPRLALVGEAPGPNSDWSKPLIGGSSGGRLAKILGLSLRGFLDLFETYNLISKFPSGKWPSRQASKSAILIMDDVSGRLDGLVLLGRKVASAFGLGREEVFSRHSREGLSYLLLPHPSGISKSWDPCTRRAAWEALREFSEERRR
jgi:uracil-DNA glycosylase